MAKTYEPKWYEQYDLHIYDENFQTLDVMVRDKTGNTVIGRFDDVSGGRKMSV